MNSLEEPLNPAADTIEEVDDSDGCRRNARQQRGVGAGRMVADISYLLAARSGGVVFFRVRGRGRWRRGQSAEDVLAERYARGEIAEDEYRERLGVLKGSR